MNLQPEIDFLLLPSSFFPLSSYFFRFNELSFFHNSIKLPLKEDFDIRKIFYLSACI